MISFKENWQRIRHILALSFVFAKVKFKLKNEGSYLGIFWYLLSPILTFLILFFIFSDRLGNDIYLYPLYLLLGIIIFNFFQNTTLEAARNIQEDKAIIKSIKFPMISLVLAVLFKNIFSHCFEIILFFAVCIFFKVHIIGIFYYILLLIPFCCFVFGVCLILCSLNVYFTDVEKIWNFFVKILWIATPIFYSIGGQARLFYFNLFNPIYYFITIFRDLIIYNKSLNVLYLIAAIGHSLLFLLLGIAIFNRLKSKFAEMV